MAKGRDGVMKGNLHKKGFTLLEILVAVMVIGVLAAVAIPKIGQAVEKFRAQEAIHLIQNIAAAQERYRIDSGDEYYPGPDDFDGLDIEIPELQYFDPPVNGGTSSGWSIFIDRSNEGYQLWANRNTWPVIYCGDEPGGPNAAALCNAIGLIYVPSLPGL